jgi:putative tricarboxylic transport membrane protein
MPEIIDIGATQSALGILSSSWSAWVWVIPGLLVGLFFGAMPGISITMAMAICLPMTLYMDFLPAVIFLTSIYTGAGFGGAVPAILINIPGTSAAVATTFDGYPMARQGRHNEALGAGLLASVVGTLASYVLLYLTIVPMAEIVLKMGPLEMLVVAVWGMMLIGSLTGDSMARGLLAGAFGVLLGTIGMNTAGYIRGTMGIPWLLDGVSPIPAMMGLLAASQLFGLIGTRFLVEDEAGRNISLAKIMRGVRFALGYPGVILRGSVIGIVIGAAPGVGASVANLLAYAETKRTSPDPESFGKGNPKGVVASESANSSSEGGSMATLFALGIPGGSATAILLAAFAMHNIVGGPQFISEQMNVVYAIIISNFAQALLLFPVGIAFVYCSAYIVRVPMRFLIPVVLVVATFGSYAIDGNSSGPITLWVFSIIGWAMVRYEYPVAATVVGLLLGRLLENNAVNTYQISGGDPSYILERPAAVAVLVLMALSFGATAWSQHKRQKQKLAGETLAG